MKRPKLDLVGRWARLSRRERIILVLLGLLLVAYGIDAAVTKLHLEPRRELEDSLNLAEARAARHARLLSREEEIREAYETLGDRAEDGTETAMTETGVLLRLEQLAGAGVTVTSVVPRLGMHEGRRVLIVAMDFEGSLNALVDYMAKVSREMPSEIASMTLAPRIGGNGDLICRLSLRVDGLES